MVITPLCELLGLKFPIFQGGMAWVSDAKLAAAVSNAGGLGIIAAGNAPPDLVLREVRQIKLLTEKPFGLNIMLLSPYSDDIAQIAMEEKVPIVTTGAGNPSKYMKSWISKGIKVIPVIPSVALAKRAEGWGASAVIAEGHESGGHIGETTTLALLPQVCDAVSIPVIGAGGIGDGRGIAAALILGAVGVQVGTRFLTAKECSIHENYKKMVLKAKDIDTITTGKRLGHPVRALKNQFTREFFSKEYDSSVTNEEMEAYGAGALKLAAVDGDEKRGCFMAGQIAGLLKCEQTANEIINEMFDEAEKILDGASKWVR